MPERRGVSLLPAALAAVLALAAAGCSEDRSGSATTGTGPGGTSGGDGASAPFELVSTDQLSVSPDGGDVAADCWNGICRWDTASGSLELVPDRGSVAVAPDWSTLATVDVGDVVLEDLDSDEPVAELAGLTDDAVTDGSPVTSVAYSPDSMLVAAAGLGAGEAGRLLVWSTDGTEEASFDTVGEVHRIAFSPAGDRIATVGNGPVEVHDLASGESQQVASGEGGTVAWSADGAWLVGPGVDDHPVVWDTATWALAAELRGSRLHEAAFAPAGDLLALTTLGDIAVTLWDPGAGTDTDDVRRLDAHTSEPGAVAWSPDAAVLYSVSADDGVIAWDPSTGDRADVTFEVPEGR